LNIEIIPFFTSEVLNELAKEVKFVQREYGGKIDGDIFLDLIVFHNENLKEQSLEDLSGILKDAGIDISKQVLQKRFNEYAVLFLSTALEKLLQQQFQSSAINLLENEFNRVINTLNADVQRSQRLVEFIHETSGDLLTVLKITL